MATDKRLDQVSQLTDFDYALIVKGDQVAKISSEQLASVMAGLIGPYTKDYMRKWNGGTISDANSVTESGFMLCFNNVTNTPQAYGTLISYHISGQISQMFVAADEGSPMFSRSFTSGNWTPWHRCDNFGANTKEELASMVAGIIVPVSSSYGIANKRRLTREDDANNLSDGRYYYVEANIPANSIGYNATLFQFSTGERSFDRYQIVFDFNSKAVHLRMYIYENGWTDWKELFSFLY